MLTRNQTKGKILLRLKWDSQVYAFKQWRKHKSPTSHLFRLCYLQTQALHFGVLGGEAELESWLRHTLKPLCSVFSWLSWVPFIS